MRRRLRVHHVKARSVRHVHSTRACAVVVERVGALQSAAKPGHCQADRRSIKVETYFEGSCIHQASESTTCIISAVSNAIVNPEIIQHAIEGLPIRVMRPAKLYLLEGSTTRHVSLLGTRPCTPSIENGGGTGLVIHVGDVVPALSLTTPRSSKNEFTVPPPSFAWTKM